MQTTIEREKQLEPGYFPIREEDVYTETGLETEKKAIIRDDTNVVLGVVSKKYHTVLNQKLVKIIHQSFDDAVLNYNLAQVEISDQRLFVLYRFPDIKVEIQKGDEVEMTLEVVNSYDASHCVSINLGGFRLVCMNGLRVGKQIFAVSQKHYEGFDFQKIVGSLTDGIELYQTKIQAVWTEFSAISLDGEAYVTFKDLQKDGFPEKYLQKAWAQLEIDTQGRSGTLWDLYNSFTQVLTHDVQPEHYERERILSNNVFSFLVKKMRSMQHTPPLSE